MSSRRSLSRLFAVALVVLAFAVTTASPAYADPLVKLDEKGAPTGGGVANSVKVGKNSVDLTFTDAIAASVQQKIAAVLPKGTKSRVLDEHKLRVSGQAGATLLKALAAVSVDVGSGATASADDPFANLGGGNVPGLHMPDGSASIRASAPKQEGGPKTQTEAGSLDGLQIADGGAARQPAGQGDMRDRAQLAEKSEAPVAPAVRNADSTAMVLRGRVLSVEQDAFPASKVMVEILAVPTDPVAAKAFKVGGRASLRPTFYGKPFDSAENRLNVGAWYLRAGDEVTCRIDTNHPARPESLYCRAIERTK